MLVCLVREICCLSAASLEGSKTPRERFSTCLPLRLDWTSGENSFFLAKIPKFQAFLSFSCEVNEWLRSLELPAFLHSALQHGAVDDSEVRAGSTQTYGCGCCCASSVRILLVTWKWSTPNLGRFKPLSCEDAPRRNLPSKLLRRHRGRRIRAARTCCALDREGCNQSIEAFEIDWPPFPATWSLMPSTTGMTNASL